MVGGNVPGPCTTPVGKAGEGGEARFCPDTRGARFVRPSFVHRLLRHRSSTGRIRPKREDDADARLISLHLLIRLRSPVSLASVWIFGGCLRVTVQPSQRWNADNATSLFRHSEPGRAKRATVRNLAPPFGKTIAVLATIAQDPSSLTFLRVTGECGMGVSNIAHGLRACRHTAGQPITISSTPWAT